LEALSFSEQQLGGAAWMELNQMHSPKKAKRKRK
jgi:hypothetical protein